MFYHDLAAPLAAVGLLYIHQRAGMGLREGFSVAR
jgi:hypothetical protein